MAPSVRGRSGAGKPKQEERTPESGVTDRPGKVFVVGRSRRSFIQELFLSSCRVIPRPWRIRETIPALRKLMLEWGDRQKEALTGRFVLLSEDKTVCTDYSEYNEAFYRCQAGC